MSHVFLFAFAAALPATAFDCAALPALFWPVKSTESPVPDCETRLVAFFDLMSWGVPEETTYQDHLSSITDSSALLEELLLTDSVLLAALESLNLVSSDVSLFPSLSPDLAPYGEVFYRITAGFPRRTEVFKLLMDSGDRTPTKTTLLVLKIFVFVSFVPSAADSDLDVFRRRLCDAEEVQELIAEGFSHNSLIWDKICLAPTVLELFELSEPVIFNHLLRLHVSEEVAERQLFYEVLEEVFDFEPSEEMVKSVQESFSVIDPENFFACLGSISRVACKRFQSEALRVRRFIRSREDMHILVVNDGDVVQRFRQMYVPGCWGDQFPKNIDHRSIKPQLFRSPLLLNLRSVQTSPLFKSAFPHLKEWPTVVRYSRATDPERKALEVFIGYHARNLNAFIGELLKSGDPRFSIENVHVALGHIPRNVAMEIAQTPLELLPQVVAQFVTRGSEGVLVRRFIRLNTEEPEAEACCFLCTSAFEEGDEEGKGEEAAVKPAVTLCRPVSARTGQRTAKHQICLDCAESGRFLDWLFKEEWRCPLCKERVDWDRST